MNKTTISIITPCINSEKYISKAIESVLNQTAIKDGRVNLEYIIYDGGSTDGTLDIIRSFENENIILISEKDEGMYDALAKGLSKVSGDIIGYINSDDYYNEHAFDIVTDIFETHKVEWLTGFRVIYNDRSHVIDVNLPYRYRRSFIKSGLYATFLPFIEQESTFWSRSLNELIDFEYLSGLKYSGDYYLWTRFAEQHDLKIVSAHLGGFRYRRGQLSENVGAYRNEVREFTERPSLIYYPIAFIDKLLGHTSIRVKKYLNGNGIISYSNDLKKWI